MKSAEMSHAKLRNGHGNSQVMTVFRAGAETFTFSQARIAGM